MKYPFLGRTGVRVSELCLGTMPFGTVADQETSAAMFHRCREAGINFFDCADVYGDGRAEEVLGQLIAGCRDEVVITSKVGFPMGEDVNGRGLSRRHVVRSVEASLRRLNTDRLDLYFLHTFDPHTSIEETLRALDDLVQQGKILYPGASNWAAWQIAQALGVSMQEGLARVACIQPMYNLVKRQAEVEILPLAQAEGLGVITYSPLGGGLLTGKYGPTRRPQRGRLVENEMYGTRYDDPTYYEIAGRLTQHAQQRGVHPAALAVAWVASHPAVTSAIIGARNVEQLTVSLDALDIETSPQWRAEIAALSVEPPPATDRSEEQAGIIYQGAKSE